MQFYRKLYPYIPWQGGKVPLCMLSKETKENDLYVRVTQFVGKGDSFGRDMK